MAAEAAAPTTTLTAQERLLALGPRVLSDAELLAVILGPTKGANSVDLAAQALLQAAPIAEMAWATPEQLEQVRGVGPARAAAIAAAFELGRRGAWSPPRRGERCLDPSRVYELLRHVAHAEREEFHLVLLDVRGRIIKTVCVAQGSLAQCPVSPREVCKEALRAAAHSIVFVHSHPSGDASPSTCDFELTERLRAATELVGILARDHVIVAATGWYSFVEAGRWRR